MTKWEKQKRILFSIAAFIIPVIILLFVCMLEGFYPFGKVSILVADMKYQFVDYIGYMKYIFFGNDDFLYTFSKTFGGDMSGFSAYYLFNPFYLILLLFPNAELPAGILLIVILMCGCSGWTFHYLLREVYEDRFASLIFSTAYALMGYYVAYVNCIHYFFSTLLLPLVIAGLYKIYRSKKIKLSYVFAVALCVASNYYIGYMILIFTAVFFVGLLIKDTDSFGEIKKLVKTVWVVLYSTILGLMISAVSLFSVACTIGGQKSSGLSLSLSRNFKISEFFSGLYTNAFHGNVSNGLPIIYSGIIPVVFLFMYFVNKTIKVKERIVCAALFVFIIIGFWIDALNVAWLGFAHPVGFPYRNSFLFSFLVLFIGYKGFLNFKKGFKGKYANIFVAIFVIYSAFLLFTHCEYVSSRQIAITGVFVFLSLICIFMLKEGRKYVIPAIIGIIVLQCADLGYNAFYSMDAYYGDRYSEDNSEEAFSSYVNELNKIVDTVENKDNSFYRMDKLYRRSHNDAMLGGYNGLSHFSSCDNDFVKRFMGKMGFRDNGNWAYYAQGSTSFAESFMGLKYMVSQYNETSKPYEMIEMVGDKFIYQNPYALSIGFGMNESVRNINIEETDLFKLQNEIAGCFSDNTHNIYEPVKVNGFETVNVTQDGNKFIKTNKNDEAYIEYKLTADTTDFIFMYFDAPEIQNTSMTVNGLEKASVFNMYDWCIRECGHFEEGEEVAVRINLLQDEIKIDNAYFYSENKEALKAWSEDSHRNNINIEKIKSSHLIANADITEETDLLVFSIPYEEDWKVFVDGERVTTEKVLDALLAVNIENGHHIVELKYFPKGLAIGLIVSIVGIIATFCVYFFQKTQDKRRENFFEK